MSVNSIFEYQYLVMARVNFYLSNKVDHRGNYPILLYFTFMGNRISVGTDNSISKKFWNSKTHRARISHSEGKSVNDRLDDLEEKVKKMFRDDFRDESPRKDIIKQKIKEIIRPPKKLGLDDFIAFAEAFEQSAKKRTETRKNYNQTINHLKVFKFMSANFKKRSITFNDIDLNFYNEFYTYLEKRAVLSNNTIGTHIKNIKVFMRESFERGIHKNINFTLKGFKVITEETDATYLSPEELDTIYQKDLNFIPKFERIRDLFIIGCWTGLRYSDLHQVHVGNIYKNELLKVRTIKGNRQVVIPLHAYVLQILKKYSYNLPKVISNQKMNDYLKEICELSGISDAVTLTKTKGGKRISETFEKWQIISTHTARRSFATNMYNMGIPSITIMAITGHRTERSFLRYIKVTPEQHAILLLRFWKDQEKPQLKDV